MIVSGIQKIFFLDFGCHFPTFTTTPQGFAPADDLLF